MTQKDSPAHGLSSGGAEQYFDPREFSARQDLEDRHFWHLHRRELIRRLLLASSADPRGPYLEVGCGLGTVATHLNAHGFQVDYADVHQSGLDLARKRAFERLGPAQAAQRRFMQLDIAASEMPDGYRGALLFDVLEHLPDDLGALRRVRDGLPADGLLAFTVPAFRSLWSPWDDLQHHKRRYTVASARRLAGDAGFHVERVTYFFFPLFFAASAAKALRSTAGGLRRRGPATEITELVEGRTIPFVNAAVRHALGLETVWLRRRDLPFGTSVLCLARPAADNHERQDVPPG